MNRLQAFLQTMHLIFETKIEKLNIVMAEREGAPEDLDMLTLKVKLRIKGAYAEYLADSVLHPGLRQAALDAMLLLNVTALIEDPNSEAPHVNRDIPQTQLIGDDENGD